MTATFRAIRAATHRDPQRSPRTWRHVRKDGSIVHVEVSRLLVDFDGRPAVMAIIRDVTKRLEFEFALRQSEERYRRLFEAAPLPIFVFDAETGSYPSKRPRRLSHRGRRLAITPKYASSIPGAGWTRKPVSVCSSRPSLSGIQAYERMRALDPALKVIFMTGYALESAQVSAIMARGGHPVLTKPFSIDELQRRTRAMLDAGT